MRELNPRVLGIPISIEMILKFAALVFALGLLYGKMNQLEAQVLQLMERVLRVENLLMRL